MTRIVECVPNFSEGRDPAVLSRLETAVSRVPGARLLDVQSDPAHNRSVFTMVGSPDAMIEAAYQLISTARDLIDLTKHQGEHPRMGATDVVPFVPVEGITMDECVELARRLGQRVGTELGIPVYLYARAATRPSRERLPDIRKGEFEGLRNTIGTDPERDPDFGPGRIHPTAGAVAIGARPFLVAYNIYLDTPDVALANEISKSIRTSSGGLPAVQAKGFLVDGLAQVSMNLLDIDVTPPIKVFQVVQAEAGAKGVQVARSEIVGLIPERALIGAAAKVLKLTDGPEAHLLETKVRNAMGPTLDAWLDHLAGATPTPGGGSAAALAGTLAASLVAMVGRLTTGRKAYAAVESRFADLTSEADRLRTELRRLVDEDARAFDQVMAAYRLPKDSGAEKAARTAGIDRALLDAAAVPLQIASAAHSAARLAALAAEEGNRNAASDAATAAVLALAAAKAAAYNVETNVAGLSDPAQGRQLLETTRSHVEESNKLASQAEFSALKRIRPGR
jgi:glutamate formiminotransferase/formiminotetrahydrofolate cyclodeaminase